MRAFRLGPSRSSLSLITRDPDTTGSVACPRLHDDSTCQRPVSSLERERDGTYFSFDRLCVIEPQTQKQMFVWVIAPLSFISRFVFAPVLCFKNSLRKKQTKTHQIAEIGGRASRPVRPSRRQSPDTRGSRDGLGLHQRGGRTGRDAHARSHQQ